MNRANDREGDTAPLRPPLVSLCFASAWGYATYVLYGYGRYGLELASIGCLLTGMLVLGQVKRALTDAGKIAKLRKQNREFELLDSDFGKSRFATVEDVAGSDMYSNSQGIFLGQMPTGDRKKPWRDVFYDGEGSIAVVAPPGESKTTGIVVTTGLANPGQQLILNDISAELLALLAAPLKARGYEIVVYTPVPREVSALVGWEVTDVGLDIFSGLTPDMPADSVRGQLQRSMKWLMPGRANSEAKDEFFLRAAQMVGSFFAMHEMTEGRKPSVPALRRHVMAGMGALPALCEQASSSPTFGGVYGELARSLATLLEKAPQQLAGGWGIAEQYLDPFDETSAMGRHTKGSTFDPRVLKSDRKVAVFVVYTLEHFETYGAPLAMTLTYLLDTVASATGPGKVTAIIDETGALNMPKLADMLNFYRKTNVRCALFYQDVLGQTEKNLGKCNTKQILAACKLKIGMGLQEPETLEMFSKLCGTKSVATINRHDRQGVAQVVQDPTRSFAHQSVPILRPEEIRLLQDILVVGGSLPPLLLQRVRYWEREHWRKAAGPSPFYKGDQGVAQ